MTAMAAAAKPRLRSRLAAAAFLSLAIGLSGCMGYMRPMIVQDGEKAFLVLSAYPLDPDSPSRTLIFLNRFGGRGDWERLSDRNGAARAAAAWEGELWLFYPSVCAALTLEDDDLASRTMPFEPGWTILAAAAHQGDLWVFGTDDPGPDDGAVRLLCVRRRPGGASWEPVPGEPPVCGAATQLSAASSGDGLWLLWRRRGADGGVSPEIFSACWRDGVWTSGPARDIGRSRYATAADPSGRGVLVGIGSRPKSALLGVLPHSSRLLLYRLSESGWTELPPTGATWRELGSVLLGPALAVGATPEEYGPPELLAVSGRNGSVAVLSAPVDESAASGPWQRSEALPVDLVSPEMMLIPALFLAAMLVGAGLGMIAVRRRRTFPLHPGQPRPAPLTLRGAAWALDNFLLGLALYAAVAGSGLTLGALLRDNLLIVLSFGTFRLLFIVYGWVFEARWGATPGKLLFGLRLADDFGHRPSARAALIRNLLRIVDELTVVPLPALLVASASRMSRRLGDMLARTVVTTVESFTEVHEDRHRKSDRFGLPR